MKKNFPITIILLIVFLFFAGCAKKLFVKEMTINPSPISLGDEVISYVKFNKSSDEMEKV